jgi:hypothetical protein
LKEQTLVDIKQDDESIKQAMMEKKASIREWFMGKRQKTAHNEFFIVNLRDKFEF